MRPPRYRYTVHKIEDPKERYGVQVVVARHTGERPRITGPHEDPAVGQIHQVRYGRGVTAVGINLGKDDQNREFTDVVGMALEGGTYDVFGEPNKVLRTHEKMDDAFEAAIAHMQEKLKTRIGEEQVMVWRGGLHDAARRLGWK